jgi:chemotaxis protein CheX
MSADLENILKAAASTVFTTMLNTTPDFEPHGGNFLDDEERVAGTVGITGSLDGMIYFYASASFSRRIACRMLSMSEAELDSNEIVNDVIGELTNMMAGQIKVKLFQAGSHCLLTVPSVMRGANFKTVAIGHNVRKTVHFQCLGGKAILEASLKL